MKLRKRIVALAIGALAVVLMSTSVSASGAEVTSGKFGVFSEGVGSYDAVDGKAQMVRTASGATIVSVTLTGLRPGNIYGSHVHKKACADGDAGGHYSFGYAVPGGAHPSGSEIWPGPFTANAAGNATGHTRVGATAGVEAVSVVVHAPSGAKIACADLS